MSPSAAAPQCVLPLEAQPPILSTYSTPTQHTQPPSSQLDHFTSQRPGGLTASPHPTAAPSVAEDQAAFPVLLFPPLQTPFCLSALCVFCYNAIIIALLFFPPPAIAPVLNLPNTQRSQSHHRCSSGSTLEASRPVKLSKMLGAMQGG